MILHTLLFYMFSAVMLGSALMVISMRNSVHSVLFLILAFFNSAGLFVLMGAEFVAMLMVIVYVGAVAVLFLFVVMMMNVNFAAMRQGFAKYLPLALCVAVLLFVEIYLVLDVALYGTQLLAPVDYPTPALEDVTNTKALGRVLYTDFVYPFQMAGIILFVAMIGAIVLTLRERPGVRRQSVVAQVTRDPKDCVDVVDVPIGKGV